MGKEKSKSFLKGLFFEEEAENDTGQKQQITATTVSQPLASVQKISGGSPKTKEFLKEALADGDKDFGYTKFKQSLDAMKGIIPDEKIRYVSSFITSKTLGVTKEKLVSTAEASIKVLDRELKRFEEATEEQTQATVVSGEKNVEKLAGLIQAKTSELQKLTEEITSLQKQKSEAEAQVITDKNKIEMLKQDFNLSYTEMVNEVKSDITKISNYLEA